MTEVPEYLLERSRERRAALGLGGGDEGAAAAVPATTESAAEVAPAAESAAPVPAPAPEIEQVEPPKPIAPWVEAAEERKRIPVWMAPVALFLPIWGFMIWGTLEEPTREATGPIAEGGEIYAAQCATCHGGGGGGGVGYQLNDGEVLLTFPQVEGHLAWVVNGTENTGPTYGDPGRPGGQRETGMLGNMPSFAALSSAEVMEVVLYERITHGQQPEVELEP
ncbi:MAG: c-type cytochrome, partial [Acidimicrobiales bacterium]